MSAFDRHVVHLRSSAGLYGAEHVILGVVPALSRLGVGATVASVENWRTPVQPLHEAALARGLPAVLLRCRGRFDAATVLELRRVIAKHRRVLLHVHDYKSAFYAWLARGGRSDVPIVATSHGLFATDASLRLYTRIENLLARQFERLCLVSAEMRDRFVAAGVPASRIVLIENGIDTERFAPEVAPLPREHFGLEPGDRLIGSTMRLTEQKNPLGLLEAFAQVRREEPRARLLVAGDGPLREAMTERARALGVLDALRLPGAVAEPERLYPMLDAFALASHFEGLPLALLEAMSAARPLAATAVGHVPRVLEATGTEPVPPADPEALAQRLLEALRGPATVPALRARVIARYSVARMARDYLDVYETLGTDRHAAAVA